MLPQPQIPPQPIKHEIEIIGTSQKEEIDDIQEEEELENLFDEFINETEDFIEHTSSCINARDDEDDDALRRRGKLRRKKSKTNVQVITFTPSNEPETQVAQIDDLDQDSPYVSSRHSLVPDSAATSAITKIVRKNEDFAAKAVYHTDDSLKTLRMGLNVEIVECVFDRYVSCKVLGNLRGF
jgi:sugar-specific transcriptional regulator TrmB